MAKGKSAHTPKNGICADKVILMERFLVAKSESRTTALIYEPMFSKSLL